MVTVHQRYRIQTDGQMNRNTALWTTHSACDCYADLKNLACSSKFATLSDRPVSQPSPQIKYSNLWRGSSAVSSTVSKIVHQRC